MTRFVKNPWGSQGGPNVQRSDLWQINFQNAIDLVKNPVGLIPSKRYQQLISDAGFAARLNFTAQRVVLPELSLQTTNIIQGTYQYNLPSYQEPLSVTRIDFLYDINADRENEASETYSFLEAWRLLALAGQAKGDGNILALTNANSKPAYKADVTIQFLAGSSDINVNELVVSSEHTMFDAWVSEVQLNTLSYENGKELAIVVATLQAATIQ